MALIAGAPREPVDTTPSRWIIPTLTLATFVSMLNAMALGPFLPVISEDLGTSVALLGQVPALSMLLAALIGFVAGPLADRVGYRRALWVSLFVAAASALGIGLAPGYLILLMAALLGAGGRAITQPIAVVIAGSQFTGDQQRRAISWVMAGVTGAVIIGIPALTGIAESFSWRIAFVGLAGMTLILMILVRCELEPDRTRNTSSLSLRGIVTAYRPLARHRPTLGLIGATLLGSAGVWSMATYLGAFYDERYGYTTQQIGWVYLVPGVTLFVGSLLAGGRVGSLPLRPLVIIPRIMTGLAVGCLFILPLSATAGLALLAVQGITTGISGVAVVLLLTLESPAGKATTLTLNTAALSLGTACGSALGGLLLAIGDFSLIGFCSLVLSCSSAALVWTCRERSSSVITAANAGK